MSNLAIKIEGLVKVYRNLTALDDLNLSVREGEFFGLLGPNGAGKTSTINILSGLSVKSSGEVSIFGHDVEKDFRACRRAVGLVPQEFNFDQFAPCEKMLIFQGGFFGIPREQCRERAAQLLNQFGLMDKRKTQARQLSGGMKRRLIIARALMHQPKLLILDEPTAGVDVDLRKTLWEYLGKLNKEGVTILLTTHYIEEAEHLCDSIGIIHKGKIVAQDETRNMVEQLNQEVVVVLSKQAIHKAQLDKLREFSPLQEGDKREVILQLNQQQISYQTMLDRLKEVNIPISHIRPADNRLEQVYIQLTKEHPV